VTPLAARSERFKLARLVDLDPDDLLWLDAVDPDAVTEVRNQITDLLFEQGSGAFGPLLQASRLLPRGMVAKITEAVFPPALTAQMAGLLDPSYAGDLVGHFDTGYMADLGAAADPRHIEHLVPHLPDDVIVAVAAELVASGDHLTAGRLLGLAPAELFPTLVDNVTDDRHLIEIAFFLEHTDALDAIVSCVADDRVAALMDIATAEDRWPEAVSLAAHVGDENAARIARIAARQPADTLRALVAATEIVGMWVEVLDLVGHVDDDEMDGIAAIDRLAAPEVVVAAAEAADSEARRMTLARIAAAMTPERQQAVAAALEHVDDARADELMATADSLGLLADLHWD
jgi:hypothetical protein